jgi:hypothetical protein
MTKTIPINRLSDRDQALVSALFSVSVITNDAAFCPDANGFFPDGSQISTTHVFHAAVTMLEIADGLTKVKDENADDLQNVLDSALVIINYDDTFPDGFDGSFDDWGDHIRVTPANVRAAGRVLMSIADHHDRAVV